MRGGVGGKKTSKSQGYGEKLKNCFFNRRLKRLPNPDHKRKRKRKCLES